MKIGTNTYGLGKYLKQDSETVWSGLKEAGVTSIEPNISFSQVSLIPERHLEAVKSSGLRDGVFPADSAADTIQMLRNRGFEVYSIYLQDTRFDLSGMNEVADFMQANEIHYAVYSFNNISVEEVKALVPSMRKILTMFRSRGMELLLHNHTKEWVQDGDTCVMSFLLEEVPEIRFELDVGWTEFAGISSPDVLREYPERFALLHLKEIKKGAVLSPIPWNREPICTAPGEGILPLREIMRAAAQMPLGEEAYIIDQDDSESGDIVNDIRKGVRNIGELFDSVRTTDDYRN